MDNNQLSEDIGIWQRIMDKLKSEEKLQTMFKMKVWQKGDR